MVNYVTIWFEYNVSFVIKQRSYKKTKQKKKKKKKQKLQKKNKNKNKNKKQHKEELVCFVHLVSPPLGFY